MRACCIYVAYYYRHNLALGASIVPVDSCAQNEELYFPFDCIVRGSSAGACANRFRPSQSLPAPTIRATFFRTAQNAEQRDLPRVQRTARHEPKRSHAEFRPPASFAFRTQTITSIARMKRK